MPLILHQGDAPGQAIHGVDIHPLIRYLLGDRCHHIGSDGLGEERDDVLILPLIADPLRVAVRIDNAEGDRHAEIIGAEEQILQHIATAT